MDVEKIVAVATAAGIELADRRRNDQDNGWVLRFSNGATLEVTDGGNVTATGKNTDSITRVLDLPAG
jgi:hypothetical protein